MDGNTDDITSNISDTLTVKIPNEPDRITFEAAEFMVGSDQLCMMGDWGLDFEKINILEFIMGEKREKKFVFKKV